MRNQDDVIGLMVSLVVFLFFLTVAVAAVYILIPTLAPFVSNHCSLAEGISLPTIGSCVNYGLTWPEAKQMLTPVMVAAVLVFLGSIRIVGGAAKNFLDTMTRIERNFIPTRTISSR